MNIEISKIRSHYKKLEAEFPLTVKSDSTTYRSPVNFQESMALHRHRWYPYKEGFSPNFVRSFISEFSRGKGVVFDPFCGSGTTPIVAGEMGIKGIGFDVSPLTTFIAQTKSLILNEHEISSLRQTLKVLLSDKLSAASEKPLSSTVRSYFEPGYLDALLRLKYFAQNREDEKQRKLLLIALLSAIEPFSTHRKAGNGLKRKTRSSYQLLCSSPLESVREYAASRLGMFITDLEQSLTFVAPTVKCQSSLDEQSFEGIDSISTIITSPPYANCFDYSKIYMAELWLGDFFKSSEDQKLFRQSSIRSHVHATWAERYEKDGNEFVERFIQPSIDSQTLWSRKIGGMISGYYRDLGRFLRVVKPRLLRGAPIGLVVGNSFYGGVPVATDLLLAELGQSHGYIVDAIIVYRGVIPSSQQYVAMQEDKKYMRESLVVLRKR